MLNLRGYETLVRLGISTRERGTVPSAHEPNRADLLGFPIRCLSYPCYNFTSPERYYVEADAVISSAGGSKIPRIKLLISDKLQIPRFARDDKSGTLDDKSGNFSTNF
jgi:hypothetical protein